MALAPRAHDETRKVIAAGDDLTSAPLARRTRPITSICQSSIARWLGGKGRCYCEERPDPPDCRSWEAGPADRVEDLLVGQDHHPLVRLGILADLRYHLLV